MGVERVPRFGGCFLTRCQTVFSPITWAQILQFHILKARLILEYDLISLDLFPHPQNWSDDDDDEKEEGEKEE